MPENLETIALTAPDKSHVDIIGARVVRLRGAFRSESTPPANTRIDWIGLAFVLEEPDAVAALVMRQHRNLAQLKLPGGAPVWFDAMKADGPVRIVSSEKTGGVQSALMLAGRKLYVSSTPQQVSDAIRSAGGTPLPIPKEAGAVWELMHRMRNWIAPPAIWE